jgi:glycosyltransferase involved in cell wall biosynthesis
VLVLSSTFPAHPNDGTPAFVLDASRHEAKHFDVTAVVPRVPGAARDEHLDGLAIRRFTYFPSRWEDLADGAILENLREKPRGWLQVVPFLIAEILALRRAVRQLRPDVIHAHWLLPQGLIARLAAPGTPLVVTTLGGDVYALEGRVMRAVKGWIARGAAAVTTQNDEMRARIDEAAGVSGAAVVMPLGADTTAMASAAAATERQPRTLLFAGRLAEKKGLDVLLRALEGQTEADWSLELIGDGPLRARLEATAAELPGTVWFRGKQGRGEVAAAMGRCEIFVLPSRPAASGDQEGLPLVLLEAMAAGCAIVASRLPGIDEVIADGESGLLVPAGDPQALRAAIDRLLAEPELRSQLGAAAAKVAEDYSVEAAGDRFVALLRRVIAEAPPGAKPGGRRGGGSRSEPTAGQ